ncbi:hypothetical protein POTOM_055435 [Populus tomentosa]|uniref:Uncharacterized protein n=1 Tax=Populus tomentosa TaxID=118781 RepID=A0A8X8C5R3_POPTO|nr:hypothetical protein POTOM_055435 [Populus tomentosa]
MKNASSDCSKDCNNNDGDWYEPAYSTRLNYESGTRNVFPSDSSDPMGMIDPIWTQSNWRTTRLRAYIVQDAVSDCLVLP